LNNKQNDNMTLLDAQADMRRGYFGGGPGVIVSGTVWLIAGIVALVISEQASVFALFIGGMAIYPLGTVIAKGLGRTGNHSSGNPLAPLAIETTVLLFIGIFIAFVVVQIQSSWFFPIMMLIIGGRYLMFQSIYGMHLYWVVGALLIAAGAALLFFDAPFATGAFIGGSIEIVFSLVIFMMMRRAESPAVA